MMRFIIALIGVFAIGMNQTNGQSPQNTWDPRFDEINITQRVGQETREIVTYDFKRYWPSYPFSIRLSSGPIVIFPKVGPPPIYETDNTIQWDENWIGEVHVVKGEETQIVGTFNRTNQSQGVTIPQSSLSSRNSIVIYIYSFVNGEKNIYDRFFFTLSGVQDIDDQIGDGGDGGTVIIEIPCYITSMSSFSGIFDSPANSSSFSVTTSKESCSWSISKNVPWITISGDASRTGNSTVSYAVAENTTTEVRVGSISVGGNAHVVIQRGKIVPPPPPEIPCISFITDSVREFPQVGGSSSFTVSLSRQDCSWNISKDQNSSWLTISGSTTRTGNSTITYSVLANETTSIRTATLSFLNSSHVVVQRGKPETEIVVETPCYSLQISTASSIYNSDANSGSFNIISSKEDCAWNITKDVPWITISGPTTRSGSGSVSYSISENQGSTFRTGTIVAFNHRHSVVQMPKEDVPEQPTPRLQALLANVLSGTRILNSTELLVVDQNSIDPILGNGGEEPPPTVGFGYVQAWGRNNLYQYGDGSRITYFSPQMTMPENIWKEISAGVGYAAAIDRNGVLFTWGTNTFGQLGTGDVRQRTTPTRIETTNKWSSISAGRGHLLLLAENGTIWSVGRNLYGQLGDNSTRNSNVPIQIQSTKNDWKYIFASADSSYAIDSQGNLHSWGYNNHGQLGTGDRLNYRTPIQISTNLRWKKIVSGESHVIGITSTGSLYGWGRNNRGQLGTGSISLSATTVPVQIGNSSDWADVAAGFEFSLALSSGGEVYSFGLNNYGQLGVGDISNRLSPARIGISSVSKVYAGYFHCFAILQNGDVYSWGRNEDGQLGLGFNNPRRFESPTRNQFLERDVLQLSLGDFYSLSIRGVVEENSEEDDIPLPIQLQSVILVNLGNSISISWKGTALVGKNVGVLLRRGSDTLISKNYPTSAAQSDPIVILESGIQEYILDVSLNGENQTVRTKFIVNGL